MRGNVIETVMGAVVLVVAALFLLFAYKTSQLRAVTGYPLTAEFEKIDGIRQGSDVRISGIKSGSDKVIAPGGRIKYTQSSVSLENLIGQMIFSAPGKKPAEGEAAPQGGDKPPAPAK